MPWTKKGWLRGFGRKRITRFCCLLIGGLLFSAIALHWLIPLCYTLPEGLTSWNPAGTVVKDRNGDILAHLPSGNYYRGSHTPFANLPQDLINATLAVEDKRFFEHSGVDYRATLRAILSQISGKNTSGGSTITQQLIKISSPSKERSLLTKFREQMIARKLEMLYGKEWILEAYFDRLDYGNLRLGPAAAAEYYFGKNPNQLSLAQTALLAALPQAPTRLNPRKNPESAVKRRDMILDRLGQRCNYPEDQIQRAKNEPADLTLSEGFFAHAPSIASKILRQKNRPPEIKTTIDAELQQFCQQTAWRNLQNLAEKNVTQASVIVIHNPTGEILCWIGAANRSRASGGQIDGVLLPRSAGSTLKPFVYAMAFEHGYWPGEIIPDVPITFRSKSGFDAPKNYNNTYHGPISMRQALACSQNIPAMLALMNGGGVSNMMTLLNKLGISTINQDKQHYGLGLAIGNAEVNLLELTNAFATLARRGKTTPPFWNKSTRMTRQQHSSPEIIREDICFMIEDILSDNIARQATFGRMGPLELPFRCAVKTGTSSNYRDNWCIGFTKDITVGVWVGNFNAAPMRDISGVTGAGPIFHAIITEANRRYPSTFEPPPPDVTKVTIDKRTGHQVLENDIPDSYLAEEWAGKTSFITPSMPDDYNNEGKAILDSRYSDWFHSNQNNLLDQYVIAPALWRGNKPHITSPPNQAILAIDPELPKSGKFLHLKSTLPAPVEWSSDTLEIINHHETPAAILQPGKHTIRAKNSNLNLECVSTFSVKVI